MSELGVERVLAEARRAIRRYEPAEALARVEAGSVLVDLRSHDERDRDGVIPGSIHVPRSVLEWRADESSGFANPHVARRELELVLVCNEGYSSSLAAADLVGLGFSRASDLVGGFQAWRAAGLPTIPAPKPNGGLPGMGGPDL
jgi:rhodanese-related sulfurtransferase